MEDTKKYTWKDIQIHDEERRYFINAAQTAIVIAEGKFGITFHLYRLDDDGLYYARYGREKLTGDTVTMDIDEPNDEIFKEVLVLPEKLHELWTSIGDDNADGIKHIPYDNYLECRKGVYEVARNIGLRKIGETLTWYQKQAVETIVKNKPHTPPMPGDMELIIRLPNTDGDGVVAFLRKGETEVDVSKRNDDNYRYNWFPPLPIENVIECYPIMGGDWKLVMEEMNPVPTHMHPDCVKAYTFAPAPDYVWNIPQEGDMVLIIKFPEVRTDDAPEKEVAYPFLLRKGENQIPDFDPEKSEYPGYLDEVVATYAFGENIKWWKRYLGDEFKLTLKEVPTPVCIPSMNCVEAYVYVKAK